LSQFLAGWVELPYLELLWASELTAYSQPYNDPNILLPQGA